MSNDLYLDNLDQTFLLDHGYFMLRSRIQKRIVTRCKNIIDDALHRAGGNPSSKEDAQSWVREKSSVQSNKELLDLVNQGLVREHLNEIFKDSQGVINVSRCQIVLRFPGERVDPDNPDSWKDLFHVDNFTEKDLNQRRSQTTT